MDGLASIPVDHGTAGERTPSRVTKSGCLHHAYMVNVAVSATTYEDSVRIKSIHSKLILNYVENIAGIPELYTQNNIQVVYKPRR